MSFLSFLHLTYFFILFLLHGKYVRIFIGRKNKFLFEDVAGFTYKKSMISTCIWSEAETIELKLKSRRKIKF